jgi:SNF2 family DNA or RNA helicase
MRVEPMPLRLSLTLDQHLELNALEQEGFSIEEEGIDLVLPFKTIERGPHHIVIDPQGKLGEVMEYIITALKKTEYPFKLDLNLEKCWDNYLSEGKKIQLFKKKKAKPEVKTDFSLGMFKDQRKPLNHQIIGIKHALKVENAANFSVPGSGKTQIALGVFVSMRRAKLVEKALVIGPASCFEPWESESKECLKRQLRIMRWSGSIVRRRKLSTSSKNADVILVTYHTACNDHPLLEQLMRRYRILLILDESHHVKNAFGIRSQVVLRLSPFASKRLILTGTPVPHSLADLWTQFTFLWPSRQLLGEFYGFKEDCEKDRNPVKKLRNELAPFFVRTTKKDLHLPEIKSNIISVRKQDVPFEQGKIIELLELRTLIEARKFRLSDVDMNLLRKWRTARMIRLLQASSNPALLLAKIDSYGVESDLDIDTSNLTGYVSVFSNRQKIPAKIKVVLETARRLVENGEKIVIWTWFVDNIKLLKDLLKEYHPLMLYGDIKPYEESDDLLAEESREGNIRDFKMREDRPILLANPAACAESISLHKHCQNAIYLDRNFNCGQFLQSMDRIHRVGMPHGTTATYHIPIINCAIERTVDKRLKKRQQVLYNLLNDPMPVLGVDEDLWIADTGQEIDEAFSDMLQEIKNDKTKKLI